ncbi:MAG: PAS domain S-box protein [Deltaproteobacteria bacterium]|nr:PAS domain S-box protein [Deltaproteobacteria bacterium]
MKPSRHFSQILQWSAIAVVVAAVVTTGVLTNITLRSIEKNLPITLLTELEALELLIEDLAEVVSTAEATRMTPTPENYTQLRHKVRIVSEGVVKLRNTYVFDNLVQASAFHAVVAPAISDMKLWLEEGVSGYGPETATTLDIALSRITRAFSKARALYHDSQKIAQNIMNEQRNRLEHFLLSVNLLFLLTLVITAIMIFLIARRQVFFRRELEVQTELRRTEKTLQETEELYGKLIAAISDIVVRTDVNGRILFLNDVALRISGYQSAEVLGKNLLEFIAPEDRASAIENLKLIFDHKIDPKKYAIVMKDGKKIPFEISSDVLRRNDGSPYEIVNICRDISKRLQAEEALRESEKQYRLLVENANDAIFIAQDGKIKFPNPRTLEILGFTEEQPEEIPFINFIHPKDREMIVDLHRRRMSGKDHLPTNLSFRIINTAGREYTVQQNAVSIAWEGRPASLNFVRDITDQLNLEASLRQAQKMEAIGTLAGGIAHDFNNLLMGIQGRISLMMFGMGAAHPFFEHLTCIEDCVKNATDLTRQLLGFARGGKYEIKPTRMNDILDQSIEMFGRTRKEIQIHKNYEAHLWTVEVDQGQMHQVLLNLFVNACQAMPGGGNLHLRTENCVIHQDMHRPPELSPGNYVKISVTDTGVGMDDATKARIFEPFFTTKEMGRGTGLGLASSYGIIRNHGGWICADSNIGQGSTLSFYLPTSEKTVKPQSHVPETELKENKSILLVDDEDIIIDVGKQFLEVLGYTVFSARSGQEALDIYTREFGKIILVILDMIMPTMDGGETIQRLKAINPTVRIILSSGYSFNGQAAEIMDRGCNGFIQKPYSLNELSQTIRKALE